jgi:hypothetical protein
VAELTNDAHRVKVRVLKDDGYWVGLPDDLAGGCLSADTLPELFADIEFTKHSGAGLAKGVPVCVEYVAEQPEIESVLAAVYAAYLALPPDLRPVAVSWDIDNDRPADPVHTGPYTNPDQLRYLEQLHARLELTGHQG